MKKLSLLLAIICVLLYCSACFAGHRYIEIDKSEYGYVYLDTYTLTKNEENNSFDCWVKFLFTDKGQKHYDLGNIRSAIENYVFYPDRTYTLYSFAYYDKYERLIKQNDIPEYELENKYITPETLMEIIWIYLYK